MLTKEKFQELAQKERRVAFFQEMSADYLTPAIVFQAVYEEGKGSAFLESFPPKDQNHFSFIGLDPIATFSSHEYSKDPFSHLREALKEYSCKNLPDSIPLAGGAIGYMAYDAVRLLEKLPEKLPKGDLPDLYFHFYQKFIVFDLVKKTVFFAVIVGSEKTYEEGMKELSELIRKVHAPVRFSSFPKEKTEESVDINDEEFCKIVEKAKGYLQRGDIFQIVASRTFRKKYTVSPLLIYLKLRMQSPSPYLFFLDGKDFCVLGASPEKLVDLRENVVSTTPIAGTRKRGKTEEEDLHLEKELLKDPKENAEHVMLVDLGRNDIGKICKIGSVQVKNFKKIEKFSHVMHIVSEVEGIKKDGIDAIDVLQALFPAGTLSGAPKVRSMEIIEELEKDRRGLYGGAIVAINGKGNLQSCIAIRMAVLKNGTASVRAGAGIVYDSIPINEAEETRLKAESVLDAIRSAQGEKV